MKTRFTGDISLSVSDKAAAAERFADAFGCAISARTEEYVEVTAGPLKLYFVEDGTKDIAFSIAVEKGGGAAFCEAIASKGFVLDEEVSARVGEPFVRDAEGILVNVYPILDPD